MRQRFCFCPCSLSVFGSAFCSSASRFRARNKEHQTSNVVHHTSHIAIICDHCSETWLLYYVLCIGLSPRSEGKKITSLRPKIRMRHEMGEENGLHGAAVGLSGYIAESLATRVVVQSSSSCSSSSSSRASYYKPIRLSILCVPGSRFQVPGHSSPVIVVKISTAA